MADVTLTHPDQMTVYERDVRPTMLSASWPGTASSPTDPRGLFLSLSRAPSALSHAYLGPVRRARKTANANTDADLL